MPTYVCGFDGTEAAHAAVRFAARLASLAGAKVIAAHVFAPVRVGHMYAVVDSFLDSDEKRAEAERVLEGLTEEGVDRRLVASSSAAHGLHRLAEEEGAALLVVGSTPHGASGRLVPGGEAERLLHGSPCPVAVVPEGGSLDDVRTVAVAYDGEDESRAALRTAESLARRLGARLLLMGAVDPGHSGRVFAADKPEAESTAREQAQRILTQAAEDVGGGLGVECRVAMGDAGKALVEASTDDVDVLVMGSRGYGPVRSVLLGSVSRYVVAHASCPVIVVPRGARNDFGSTLEVAIAAPASQQPDASDVLARLDEITRRLEQLERRR
jgi:nucleotide-binding universal stress UspA family protein